MHTLIDQLRQKTERAIIYLLPTYQIKKMPLLRIAGKNDLFLRASATTDKRIFDQAACCGLVEIGSNEA